METEEDQSSCLFCKFLEENSPKDRPESMVCKCKEDVESVISNDSAIYLDAETDDNFPWFVKEYKSYMQYLGKNHR